MMFRIPLYAKIAGAGTAGLLLAGGAAITAAPTLTTVLSASTQPTPTAKAGQASRHGRKLGIRARRWVIRAEADVLHLTVRQLRQDVRGGTNVEQLAAKAGMDKAQLATALVNDLKPKLDKLVAAGKINSAQEKALLDRVQKGWIPLWTLKPGSGSAPRTGSRSAGQSQSS